MLVLGKKGSGEHERDERDEENDPALERDLDRDDDLDRLCVLCVSELLLLLVVALLLPLSLFAMVLLFKDDEDEERSVGSACRWSGAALASSKS